ncbi:MAG: hypothetical protein HZA92_06620 [Verrucomicrobia bacterium]|nr:hypothetical protein [Verrucomicrobiota bacterium]
MNVRHQLRWLFAVQAVLLAVAAWRNLHQLNPDAVAYCRIAGYYAAGQTELAVTGYWGPLVSWLMVPLLKAGAVPLVAARVVMAFSGVVFLAGALSVFRSFRLPNVALRTGACIAAVWSVFWSVRHITPDLLLAGLVALAVSATVKMFLAPCRRLAVAVLPDAKREGAAIASRRHARHAIAVGVWWGLAYLAKAVALPLALLTTAGLAVLAMSGRRELRAELAARLGLAWLGTALVAAPWIAVLSLHYGQFTFSTTGPIAHALAGPGEQAGHHRAMTTLHQPDAGRVTQWEEPSRMAYVRWSPFAGGENFRHQLAVVGDNIGICWDWLNPWRAWLTGAELPLWRRWLGTFDVLGISGLAVLIAGGCMVKCRRCLRRQRWCWALVPVVALGALYLPFFVMAEDNRYFFPALPFLWVLAVGAWGWSARVRAGFGVVNYSFAVPAMIWLAAALAGIPNQASHVAHDLAARLQASGQPGPLAGSGLLPGGRSGIYTAFLLGERWLGDDVLAGPAEFASAGARVVVSRRGSQQAESLARDSRWRPVEPAISVSLQVFVRAHP